MNGKRAVLIFSHPPFGGEDGGSHGQRLTAMEKQLATLEERSRHTATKADLAELKTDVAELKAYLEKTLKSFFQWCGGILAAALVAAVIRTLF